MREKASKGRSRVWPFGLVGASPVSLCGHWNTGLPTMVCQLSLAPAGPFSDFFSIRASHDG